MTSPFAEDQFLTFKGQRALAMMHLAMHDALNAIVPVYETYAFRGGIRPRRSDCGDGTGRTRRARLPVSRLSRRRSLTSSPDGLRSVLARRILRESWNYLGAGGRGRGTRAARWRRLGFPGRLRIRRTTRSLSDDAAMERLRRSTRISVREAVRPRVSASIPASAAAAAAGPRPTRGRSAKSRSTAPPTSTRRTNDQTAYAIWWMEFAEGSVNRLARQLSSRSAGASLASGPDVRARWRGAVRHVRRDLGREVRATTIGGRIRPFARQTPTTIPQHRRRCELGVAPSGAAFSRVHARPTPRPAPPRSACSPMRSGAMLQFTMETTTAPPGMPTRTFDSFAAAAAECADSRVRLGWHFRYATDAGLELGERIARYSMTTRPTGRDRIVQRRIKR